MIAYSDAGNIALIIPAEGFSDADVLKDVPAGVEYIFIDSLPEDRVFRSAWAIENGEIIEDLSKSKDIAHEMRIAARALEFAPLDILATIPAQADSAEAQRQIIREKYEAVQSNIDLCKSVENLKIIIESF